MAYSGPTTARLPALHYFPIPRPSPYIRTSEGPLEESLTAEFQGSSTRVILPQLEMRLWPF